MWQAVELPFQYHQDFNVPTPQQIRACTNVIQERHSVKIVDIRDGIVAKFGAGVDVSEGQALLYLERYVPDVPAPRLYGMYRCENQVFLVMQKAAGRSLESLWSTLNESEKKVIVERLRDCLSVMQSMACPWADFFGGFDGGSLRHDLFFSLDARTRYIGPFIGEAALVAGLTNNFRALVERNDRPDFKARFYESQLGRVICGHRPVLTHGDLHPSNIIVEERLHLPANDSTRDFSVTLIDWEKSGWYPEFWEFFSASSMFDQSYWEDDWCWHAQQFMNVMPAELAIMRMFDKDMSL